MSSSKKYKYVTFKMIPTLDDKNTEGKIVEAIPIEWLNNWLEDMSEKNMNIERPIKDMLKVHENILQLRRIIDLMINDWRIYDDVE